MACESLTLLHALIRDYSICNQRLSICSASTGATTDSESESEDVSLKRRHVLRNGDASEPVVEPT